MFAHWTFRAGGQFFADQLRIQGCDRIFTVHGESFPAMLDSSNHNPIPYRLGF